MLDKIRKLVNDLAEWEYDRVSSSGKETLDELQKLLKKDNSHVNPIFHDTLKLISGGQK